MWNKQQTQPEAPTAPPPQSPASTAAVVAFAAPSSQRAAASPSRSSALLGSSLHITGQLTGTEDLQIDGKVDGPISLNGHQLTVGPTAILNSEVQCRRRHRLRQSRRQCPCPRPRGHQNRRLRRRRYFHRAHQHRGRRPFQGPHRNRPGQSPNRHRRLEHFGYFIVVAPRLARVFLRARVKDALSTSNPVILLLK